MAMIAKIMKTQNIVQTPNSIGFKRNAEKPAKCATLTHPPTVMFFLSYEINVPNLRGNNIKSLR